MLKLENIQKTYFAGTQRQDALKGVSVAFRDSEFVCILGPSGSGKTTLLNIIGGLDRYTSGQISVDGVSTMRYSERDWDLYRSRCIGFVFQNYNLIAHQSVLANVELALAIAGTPRSERKKRAQAALQSVGLGDQLHKKPNQLSGGQMQRVAIARALVNDPQIILADEPTGALDSETSVQIMELLKEIAKKRLVIMVTHNAALAKQYATRTIELLDGQIVHDTDAYTPQDAVLQQTAQAENKAVQAAAAGSDAADPAGVPQSAGTAKKPRAKQKKPKKTSMTFAAALMLSFNNLRTKKGRTFLTSFAGSIGIIGIALILALSAGMQTYISDIEADTLSSYPLIIENQSVDLSLDSLTDTAQDEEHPDGAIYQSGFAGDALQRETPQKQQNDLAAFKAYLDSDAGQSILQYTSAVRYGYGLEPQIYSADSTSVQPLNPNPVLGSAADGVWEEMIANTDLLQSQYDLLAGSWPQDYHDVVLVLDENNSIRDTAMYALGLKSSEEYAAMRQKAETGAALDRADYSTATFTYTDLIGMEFRVLSNTAYYTEEDGIWVDRRSDTAFMQKQLSSAQVLRISGIIRPSDHAASSVITGTIAYTPALTEKLIEENNASAIVQAQKASPQTNVFTGAAFLDTENMTQDELLDALPSAQRLSLMMLPESIRSLLLTYYLENAGATYAENMAALGAVDPDTPESVELYLRDFQSRDKVIAAIDAYNARMEQAGQENAVISYTDLVGTVVSSVTDVINMVTYLLVGFVSVSLVVSSIMIGIITYISVLERIKEIGVLRSLGASRRDVARVFNAETAIIGLASGLIGVGTTLLLSLPVNVVIQNLTGVSNIAALPPAGALILIAVSVVLTMIAGLIPAHAAAKKEPVAALRSE